MAVYLENLAQQFAPEEILVVANRHKNSFLFDTRQKYKIQRMELLSTIFWPRWLRTFFLAKRIMKQEMIDHLIISHVLPLGYVALMLKIPFTLILHGQDLLMAKLTPWKQNWLQRILKKSENILVNSHYTKGLVLAEGVDEKKIFVAQPCPKPLPSHLDEARIVLLKEELGLDNKFILLSVNRLVARKGNDRVIEALAAMKEHLPPFKYVIVGNGANQERLEKLILKHNLADEVQIINNVTDELLPYYYALADVFIMPSRIEKLYDVEGYGIVFLEAGLYSKPSIAGNTGGVPEAVIDGQSGIIVNSEDVEDIGKAILKLMSDSELRKRMGENAFERASTCSWKNNFESIVEKIS